MTRLRFIDNSATLSCDNIFQAADGFSAHWVDAADLRQLEPRLSSAAIQGLYTYGNATLSSYEYVTALYQAAKRYGTRMYPGLATGFKTSGERVTGVMLEDGEVDCETVVVASGPWSGEAGTWLGVNIPVEPLKGEIVRIEPPGTPLQADFSGAGSSLYQRADGLIWVGSTEERVGFDKEPRESSRHKLLDGAIKLMPSIREAKVVKTLTDNDVARAIEEDPDTFEVQAEWLDYAVIVMPARRKERITARFDKDVVDWFKEQGNAMSRRRCLEEQVFKPSRTTPLTAFGISTHPSSYSRYILKPRCAWQ